MNNHELNIKNNEQVKVKVKTTMKKYRNRGYKTKAKVKTNLFKVFQKIVI